MSRPVEAVDPIGVPPAGGGHGTVPTRPDGEHGVGTTTTPRRGRQQLGEGPTAPPGVERKATDA